MANPKVKTTYSVYIVKFHESGNCPDKQSIPLGVNRTLTYSLNFVFIINRLRGSRELSLRMPEMEL